MRSRFIIAATALLLTGAACQCGKPVGGDPDGGGGGNLAPTAEITAPSDGVTLSGAGPFGFDGRGTDPEDGALTGDALVWSSDLDGQLGTGAHVDAALSVGTHRISLDVKDSGGLTARAQISVTVKSGENQPPLAFIDSPADNTTVDQGVTVTLTGHASDPEDGALSGLSLKWSSDLEGSLGSGAQVSFTANQTGANHIVLTATDSRGSSAYASIVINVVPPGQNRPPVVTISAPQNGAQVQVGTAVQLSGSATDPEDGALSGGSLAWSSNVSGALGTGASLSISTLSQGVHTITLTATDSLGLSASQSVSISVNAPNNQPPTAAITAPANGFSTFAGTAITFTGTGTDPEDGTLSGASLAWSSSLSGALGTGSPLTLSNLGVGTHQISLTVTDSGGNTDVATIQVTVLAQNQPPTASITSPSSGQSFTAGTTVQLRGSATDPEDGALTGASLVWSSNKDGVIGTGASVDTASLTVGQHTLTLTATDVGGRTGSASVTVTIAQAPAKLPPIARLTGPTSAQVGQQLSFSGATSSDPDGTIVSYTFDFGDGSAPVTGTATSATHAYATAGNFPVTLTVKDNDNLTGTAQLSVTISSTVRVPSVVDARADALGSMCQIGTSGTKVHVIYRDDTHPTLLYGTLTGSTFVTEVVDGMGFNNGGLVGTTFSMVIDSSGAPHVAYTLDGSLYYGTRTASGWTRERVDSAASPLYSSLQFSIGLNPAASERPTVVYTRYVSSYRNVVAERGTTGWTQTPVSYGTPTSQYVTGDVAFDSAGTLYIPYSYGYLGSWNGTTGEFVNLGLTASAYSPSAWRAPGVLALISDRGVEDVTVGSPLSATTVRTSLVEPFTTDQQSIAVDQGGQLRIVVNHGTDLELVTGVSGGFWTRQSLGQIDNAGVDIAVDSQGVSRACFFRAGKLVLY